MRLRIELRSDSAFGRGDGVAGLIDSEVEHDPLTGLPYIKGRTIKGLLVESCADILYALQGNQAYTKYEASAANLFGMPGSTMDDTGCLHIGPARLPDDLRQHIHAQTRYVPQQVLEAFTTIRHQTAIDPSQGKPKDGSLRATRVVLRGTFFYSVLSSSKELIDNDYQLLAACAAGVKLGGQNRTRGLGWLKVTFQQDDESASPLDGFLKQIGAVS